MHNIPNPMTAALMAALPPREVIPTLRGEPDYYGASTNIARSLQLTEVPASAVPWMHGWLNRPALSPAGFLSAAEHKEDKSQTLLVGRADNASFLHSFGYTNAQAVGSPYAYVPPQGTIRLPRSLLIMPKHTLFNMRVEADTQSELAYLRMLAPYLKHFDFAALCVHQDCVDHGLWMNEAAELGLPIIPGAMLHDRQALVRMRRLFEFFSHMTTNSMSSHVAYAAATGVRVSWLGEDPPWVLETLMSHVFNQKNPREAEHIMKLQQENYWERTFGFLRTPPQEAPVHTAWGREQLGFENVLHPKKIAQLLGWHEALRQTPAARCQQLERANQKQREHLSHAAEKLDDAINKLYRSARWRLSGWLASPFSAKKRRSFGWLDAARDFLRQESKKDRHDKKS